MSSASLISLGSVIVPSFLTYDVNSFDSLLLAKNPRPCNDDSLRILKQSVFLTVKDMSESE